MTFKSHTHPTAVSHELIRLVLDVKASYNRPLLQGFGIGKHYGLIAWSPNCISRTMKEAGEIIGMVGSK